MAALQIQFSFLTATLAFIAVMEIVTRNCKFTQQLVSESFTVLIGGMLCGSH